MCGWFDLNHFSWAGSDLLSGSPVISGQSVVYQLSLEAQAAYLFLGALYCLHSEEYKSDFRKFAQKRPLHVIIFLTVSVLPNIFLTRLVKCL